MQLHNLETRHSKPQEETFLPTLSLDSTQLPLNGLDVDTIVHLNILARVKSLTSEDGKKEIVFELKAAGIDDGEKSQRVKDLTDIVTQSTNKKSFVNPKRDFMVAGEG